MRLNNSRNIDLDIGSVDKTQYKDFSGGIREDHYIDPESTFFEQIPKFNPSYPYDLDSHHGIMAPHRHRHSADAYVRMRQLEPYHYHDSHPPDLFETTFFQNFLKENGFPYDEVMECLNEPGRCVRCGISFGQKQLSKADGRKYQNIELCAHCADYMDGEYDKTIDTSLFLKAADKAIDTVEREPELSLRSFFDKCILEMDVDKPRPESFISITDNIDNSYEQIDFSTGNYYWSNSSRYDSGYMTFSDYNGTTYAHWTPMNTYTDTEAHHRYLINISSEINEMNAIDEEALERISDTMMQVQQRIEQVEILAEMQTVTDVREITDYDITFAAV